MQIPILNGVYSKKVDLDTSYPVNLIPVFIKDGISNGYLRPTDGIDQFADGPYIDRGGINWNNVCYRVMGSKFIRLNSDGTITIIGDVGSNNKPVSMDYSFDKLAIVSNQNAFYYSPSGGLVQVTDPDLGKPIDVVWVDGYFMFTDGEFLIVTELSDPSQIDPLKYGSSEADPDPVVSLIKIRNEVYVLNRYTIEVFDNVGGQIFPFQRIEGAQIQKGTLGTNACCVFLDSVAFLGSARNESPGIYIGLNGAIKKISSKEVDRILIEYSSDDLSNVKLEQRNDKNSNHLYVHLPDKTLVFDATSSDLIGDDVWFILTSAQNGFTQFRARNFVWCYDKWLVGDTISGNIGYFRDSIGTHWGNKVRWEASTAIIYNQSMGAIFNQIELVAITGETQIGENPSISTSYSYDGKSWSQPKYINVGTIGNSTKRLVWFRNGAMRSWRIQRFMGNTDSRISILRLEVQVEGLNR